MVGVVGCRLFRLLNIAHRGASHKFPENTLQAFAAAIQAGADMCELDVQLSRDGIPIVIHDDTVDRTTDGHGAAAALTLAEIKRLDAGIRFGPGFAGARVPTLEEVLIEVAGRCRLNVELKGPGTSLEVCRLLRQYGQLETSIVSSFDWAALQEARSFESAIALGVLADRAPDTMLDAARGLDAFSVHPRWNLLTQTLSNSAHRSGLQVLVWTVDDPARMKRMIALGADGIMTNCPDRLSALIAD